MKAIGFGTEYYTLWEVEKTYRTLENGNQCEENRCTYIKNISKSLEKVREQYPDLVLDNSLKGHSSSFTYTREVWTTNETFRFGKFKYERIADCHDNSYIEWYYDNATTEDGHKDYIEQLMVSRGYQVSSWSDGNHYLISPEAQKANAEYDSKCAEIIRKAGTGEPIEFVPQYNPNEDGITGDDDFWYKFPEVAENYYNGFTYYLPVLKGKSKRVKNKTVVVKDFSCEKDDYGKMTVIIKDFEVKKG